MKKLLLIALSAMFCLGSAAQNDEVEEVDAPTVVTKPSGNVKPVAGEKELEAQLIEVSKLISKLKQITLNDTSAESSIPESIYKPIHGKGKFWHRHYVYQTLDISPTVTSDRDPNQPDYTSTGQEVDDDQVDSSLGLGMNFGYSLLFVPGREENGMLRLNRMGFAYNVGLVASFSKQDVYGVTCNFLLKAGVETGNQHMMGIGFDVLGGYGKSIGNIYMLSNDADEDDLAQPYTSWCWQYGAQLWLRTNLLKTAVKNSEMLIFARMIRSALPKGYSEYVQITNSLAFEDYWKDESWSFGVTMRYYF